MRAWRLRDRVVFPDLNAIVRNGTGVHVEPKAIAVLLELARQPGEVVSKQQLIQSVWGSAFICEDVVTNAISLLRRALGDETKNPSLIQTIPKRGYRLLAAALEEVADEETGIPLLPYFPPVRPRSTSRKAGGPRGTQAPANELEALLLRVRYLRQEETFAALTSACAYCEELIRQEPNYAAAHAELALTLFLLEKVGIGQHKDIEPRVRSAVDRALCLNERAGISLLCLAKQEYRYDWKWNSAERHFRRAVAADPQNAEACAELGLLLNVMHRFDEGLTYIHRACSLDPISPAVRLQVGHAHFAAGQWETAASQYRRLLRCSPGHLFARWGLADSLARLGKAGEAVATVRGGFAVTGTESPLLVASLARIEASGQEHRKGSLAFEKLQQQTNDPVLLAEVYTAAGEPTRALQCLDQAVALRHYRLSAVHLFPQFEALREQARYRQLAKKIGLGP